jgi:hypothetical protein
VPTTVAGTIKEIEETPSWDARVARIRQIPFEHGINEHPGIYAEVARRLYVPHLDPDFAYIHWTEFYELETFEEAYRLADSATKTFSAVSVDELAAAIHEEPRVLLILRSITGLNRQEFAAATKLVGDPMDLGALSSAKVDSMERSGSHTTQDQARVAAATLDEIMRGELFGAPPGELRSKQDKPDTEAGWASVQNFAAGGVPYSMFLHQRHYGGSFRQLLDATSTLRGDIIEDAVEALFELNRVPYIRTGSHNQAEIAERFGMLVQPAPDFVVFDNSDTLRALLECKGANDGGTARDKALRFERLHDEAQRLGGLPLIAVLSGLGWTRVNDTLGPVVRDCDGRVFSVSNLDEMLTVNPFPSLVNLTKAT